MVYINEAGSISSLGIIIIFLFIVFLINFPSFACFIIVLSFPVLLSILVLFTLRTFNNLHSSSPPLPRFITLLSFMVLRFFFRLKGLSTACVAVKVRHF